MRRPGVEDAPRRFALLGDPVGHSISPRLYGAAFAALGVRAVYEARRVSAGEVAAAMRELAARGGGNVTLPHKEAAAAALDVPSREVAESGACNTFWSTPDGGLAGDNTDVGGFLAEVSAGPPGGVEGRSILLLGAGGAARAVLLACLREGAARVALRNRSPERAAELARRFRAGVTEVRALRAGEEPEGPFDLVVNATRLGLEPSDPLPIELERLRAGAVLDLVYRLGGTRWVRRARELGVPARDGRGMLVQQAALALRRWLGVEPPIEAMRREAELALGPL